MVYLRYASTSGGTSLTDGKKSVTPPDFDPRAWAREQEGPIDAEALAGLRLLAKSNAKLRETKGLLRLSETRVEELEQVVATFEALTEQAQQPIHIAKPKRKKSGKKRHLFVALLSDTHSSEVVDPIECPLSGAGHNAEIGEARMREYFRSVSMLYREQAKTFDIPVLVLALLGDFQVNSLLHPDSATDLAPMEEVQFIYRILREGIESLLDSTDCKIVIPTVFGNHGRITPKQWYAGAASVSSEHLIYEMLAASIRDKRVTWDIRPQIIKTLEVEGWKFLVTHGDRTSGMGNYSGGVGGLSIPLKKALGRWHAAEAGGIHACAIGHFHTPTLVTGKPFGAANGSLVGPTPYSQGLENYRPTQWCWLVDLERLEVGRILPVWVD